MIWCLFKDFDVECCLEEYGFYVIVMMLEDVLLGKIWFGMGFVIFWVIFKCIVFCLICNEIFEVEVMDVLERGFLVGECLIFVCLLCDYLGVYSCVVWLLYL